MSAIGSFRHVVTLERPGPPALEPMGGYTEAWTPLAPPTWHCSITAARATDIERIGGGTITTTAELVLRGRFHADLIDAGNAARIGFKGRTFTVAAVRDRDERGIEIELLAREITGRVTTPPTGPGPAPGIPYADLVKADGAIHHWRLDELGGTFALDAIGYAHGSMAGTGGGVTLNQPGALADNAAMRFDGTAGFVVHPDPVRPPFSVELWQSGLLQDGREIFETGTAYPGFVFRAFAPGKFYVAMIETANQATQLIANTLAPDTSDGAWYHVVIVVESAPAALLAYVGGVRAPLSAYHLPPPATVSAVIHQPWYMALGPFGPDMAFVGGLDEVAIYPLALTPEQIAAHHAAGMAAR